VAAGDVDRAGGVDRVGGTVRLAVAVSAVVAVAVETQGWQGVRYVSGAGSSEVCRMLKRRKVLRLVEAFREVLKKGRKVV